MTGQQNVLGLVDAGGQKRTAAEIGMKPLHKAAMGLSDIRRAGARFKTKDLVGLLLSHGARSWRASLPVADIRLRVFAPEGKTSVKIRLK